jgi:hypothetical protein
MKKLLLFSLMALAIQTQAQNVGIGNPAPAEKLDVTGNINVTGTIKANGTDGTAGQILMKNNAGILSWGDACEYKNFKVYEFTTAGAFQNFTVPAGVSKIKVQMWGAGGKGQTITGGASTNGAGGGGGGYLEATLQVAPTMAFNVIIGEGATAANGNSSGGNTILGLPTLGYSIYAYGGENTSGIASAMVAGDGGGYNFPVSLTTAIGIKGEPGNTNITSYMQKSATEFPTSIKWGNGGDAGNTDNTGGKGGHTLIGAFIYEDVYGGGKGKVPGGGGAARNITTESDGANGRMIIYW